MEKVLRKKMKGHLPKPKQISRKKRLVKRGGGKTGETVEGYQKKGRSRVSYSHKYTA